MDRSKGPEWWQELRRTRWRGRQRKQWHSEVLLKDLVAGNVPEVELPAREVRQFLAWADRMEAQERAPVPRRLRSMRERFGGSWVVYRALCQEGDRWGVIVSAFWGAGIRLTDGEFWARGYVEEVGAGVYRITRRGRDALYPRPRAWHPPG